MGEPGAPPGNSEREEPLLREFLLVLVALVGPILGAVVGITAWTLFRFAGSLSADAPEKTLAIFLGAVVTIAYWLLAGICLMRSRAR